MKNNYDKIARYYDRLSRLVFFKSQVNAQIDQLHYLPEKGRVLIVGGGTGWILEAIAKVVPEGLHLVYVEISAKMMALSKERAVAGNTVDFVNLGIEDFYTDQPFDVICTPFLFDNFSEESAVMVFHHLDSMLRKGGLWFHTDFDLVVNKGGNDDRKPDVGDWWKTVFLALMYRFFKLIAQVEASKLINMRPYFEAADYQVLEQKHYYRKFIQSLVLEKSSSKAVVKTT
ncbi:class I SAM-dependent methyltransferase [Pedobacter gandavensis]|uniref:class I SAM-dependent methyltransferase n=1 Tax=Pedobacter gandavensis TaxID=2679963 RepID=UPI00247B222E|nr:class I SAM-dependent methyltransferase [Pedobacter gandavensis]WGQ11640.1 class I SAM-dependent methyltransferase [Pedobacter gandavensis]